MGFQDVVFPTCWAFRMYLALDYYLLGSGAANGLSGCSVPVLVT